MISIRMSASQIWTRAKINGFTVDRSGSDQIDETTLVTGWCKSGANTLEISVCPFPYRDGKDKFRADAHLIVEIFDRSRDKAQALVAFEWTSTELTERSSAKCAEYPAFSVNELIEVEIKSRIPVWKCLTSEPDLRPDQTILENLRTEYQRLARILQSKSKTAIEGELLEVEAEWRSLYEFEPERLSDLNFVKQKLFAAKGVEIALVGESAGSLLVSQGHRRLLAIGNAHGTPVLRMLGVDSDGVEEAIGLWPSFRKEKNGLVLTRLSCTRGG